MLVEAAIDHLMIRPQIHHSRITAAMIIPASFSTCTLLPDDAIRPSRPVVFLRLVPKEVKRSFYRIPKSEGGRSTVVRKVAYGAVEELLIASILVDVNRDASKRGNLGGELR